LRFDPVKVLFVLTDVNGGGAEKVVLTVLRYLNRGCIEPSLFLLRKNGVWWDEISKDTRVQFGWSGTGRIRYRSLGVLNKLLAAVTDSDIVVGALELLPSYFAYLSGALRRKPVIAWVHSDLNRQLSVYTSAAIHRCLIRLLYPRFEKIVFPSYAASASFQRLAPVTGGKAEVIYNPLDCQSVVAKAGEILPDWGRTIFRKPVVIAVGSLTFAPKGFDVLIRAHAELVAGGVDHNLLIVGEGPDRQPLEKLARDLGVSGSVFLPGFQLNPYPLVKLACALVVPSRFEAFGMVVLEAMALGVPVVSLLSATGPVEILDRGTYGLCVSGEDPAALVSAMKALLADPVLRDRYSRLGNHRAESFQPEQIVPQWENLLWRTAHESSR
jgi:glycosyltransferase involved in cell wall biosynthesis